MVTACVGVVQVDPILAQVRDHVMINSNVNIILFISLTARKDLFRAWPPMGV